MYKSKITLGIALLGFALILALPLKAHGDVNFSGMVKGEHLLVHIGDEQILPAIVVEVGRINTHTGTRFSIHAESHFRRKTLSQDVEPHSKQIFRFNGRCLQRGKGRETPKAANEPK